MHNPISSCSIILLELHRQRFSSIDIKFDKPCIGYLLEGEAEIQYRGNHYFLQPGDAIYIPAGTVYNSRWSGKWYNVGFSLEEDFPLYYYQLQVFRNTDPSLYHRMYSLQEQNSLLYYSCFYQLLADLYQRAEKSTPPPAMASVSSALEYLNCHYTEPLKVALLADLCHCSSSHFFHLFHSATGVSPIVYKNSLIIMHAREYLLNSTLSIEEISELLEISSPNYFRRLFLQFTGQSPRAYRETHLKKHSVPEEHS